MAYSENSYGGSNVPDWARDDTSDPNPFDSAVVPSSTAPTTYNRDRSADSSPNLDYRAAPEGSTAVAIPRDDSILKTTEPAPPSSFGGVYVPEVGIPSMLTGPARLDGKDKRFYETLCPRIALFTLTTFFLMAELILFLATLIYSSTIHDGPFVSGNNNGGPGAYTFYKLGANYGWGIEHGDVWRLVTMNFLFVGVLHFLVNGLCIMRLGYTMEARWGKILCTLIFLFGGITGGLWSAAIHPDYLSVGGGITMLVGADLFFIVYNYPDVSGATVEIGMIILNAVFNLVLGTTVQVDAVLYIGETLAGAFLGALLLPKITDRGALKWKVQVAGGVLFAASWLVFGLILWVGKPS